MKSLIYATLIFVLMFLFAVTTVVGLAYMNRLIGGDYVLYSTFVAMCLGAVWLIKMKLDSDAN